MSGGCQSQPSSCHVQGHAVSINKFLLMPPCSCHSRGQRRAMTGTSNTPCLEPRVHLGSGLCFGSPQTCTSPPVTQISQTEPPSASLVLGCRAGTVPGEFHPFELHPAKETPEISFSPRCFNPMHSTCRRKKRGHLFGVCFEKQKKAISSDSISQNLLLIR